MITKAIKLAVPTAAIPLMGDEISYECDFSLFRPIVEQMNEMGAPVTLYDLIELIEGKLSGQIISGEEDVHLRYTLYCKKPILNNAE